MICPSFSLFSFVLNIRTLYQYLSFQLYLTNHCLLLINILLVCFRRILQTKWKLTFFVLVQQSFCVFDFFATKISSDTQKLSLSGLVFIQFCGSSTKRDQRLNRLNWPMKQAVFQILTWSSKVCSKFIVEKNPINPFSQQNIMPDRLLGKKIKTFNIVKKLGSGAFATVFQAYDDSQQNVVAVKVTELSQLKKSKKLAELIKTQISVLKSCKNENVISYVDSFETSEFLFIVVEFCNGGDLQELLKKKGTLSEDQSTFFLKQILNGFKGLHEVGAMHRDFKAANLLLHDGVLKIADLGFAKQMDENAIAKTILGTSLTMAPQVLEEKSYGFEADIWSIGVVFYQMIYGKYPYFATNDYALIKSIKNSRPSYEGVHICANTKDFIDKCLTVDPKKRMQWKQIHKHPIIKQNETSSLSAGVLKSKLSLNALANFYEKADLHESQRGLERKSLQLKMEVLPDDMLTSLVDMKGLLTKAQVLQQQEVQHQKFDHLYVGRRNDIMFFHKFIHPYIDNLEYLKMNHSIAGFILSKKSYRDLSEFLTSMKQKKVIFYGQSNFQQYLKKESYRNMMAKLEIDIKTMEKCCSEYKSKIKLCPLQIKNELDISKTKSNNFEMLANDIVGQYLRLLRESLDLVKPEHKIELLRTIQALNYYREHSKPFSLEFDRIISKADFQQIENNIRKKNGIM